MGNQKLEEIQAELADLDTIEEDYHKEIEDLTRHRDGLPKEGPTWEKFDREKAAAERGLAALDLRRRQLILQRERFEPTLDKTEASSWWERPEQDEPGR